MDYAVDVQSLHATYLELNLCLCDILLATAAAGNLLCLGDLVPYGLHNVSSFLTCALNDDRTSALKSSSGYPSTALMLKTEFGCTVAKPPDTVHRAH